MVLSDKEIIEGLKCRDGKITQDYFYTYCRIAYHIYDNKYDLSSKPGMDFYSLAHEYYLTLCKHDFKQLEDHAPTMALKTWMINGFRFILLDKLKEVKREHRMISVEERVERSPLGFDVPNDNFTEEVRNTLLDICSRYLPRDNKDSIILQSLLVDGFKGKEIAMELGMTPSAVSQRYTRLMRDIVIPYFKDNFVAPNVSMCYAKEDYFRPSPIRFQRVIQPLSPEEQKRQAVMQQISEQIPYRTSPDQISELKENEIFVFGSNLQGMHGGGAARIARLHFGAVLGQGVGLQGQSYAIPTMQGGADTIQPYVDEFIRFAQAHPELTFLVTRIGCGIAGFTPKEIAPLFKGAIEVENISLPKDFWEIIM